MPKCDSNKVTNKSINKFTPVNLLQIFRTSFKREPLEGSFWGEQQVAAELSIANNIFKESSLTYFSLSEGIEKVPLFYILFLFLHLSSIVLEGGGRGTVFY